VIALLILNACSGNGNDSTAKVFPAPTVAWLSPANDATVTAGDVACSIVVDEFALKDLAKHSIGQPAGHVSVSVDGKTVMQTSSTTFALTLKAGAHDLGAQLLYADDDEVTATADHVCDEEDTDPACVIVTATVSVTAQ
jgi:hypothetical protein